MAEFMTARNTMYRASGDGQQARIMRKLKRDWSRHPELRAEYVTFQRYLVAMRGTTFCGH